MVKRKRKKKWTSGENRRTRELVCSPRAGRWRSSCPCHTVLIVNDTVFAHGGLVPRHVDFGLDKLNRSVSEWMRGKRIEDEETKGL